MEEARTNIERANDARLSLLSPEPAPNQSMSGRSPYNVNFVLLFTGAINFCVTGSYENFTCPGLSPLSVVASALGLWLVIAVFEAHVAVVFHRQSGVSNVVPAVRIVYLGEAAFPNTRETYAT